MKNKFYTWQGINKQGQRIVGEIAAFSMNLAKLHLNNKEITVTFISKKKHSIFHSFKKPTAFDRILFFRQLATLILASVPLASALRILSQNKEHARLKLIFTQLEEDIATGNELATSLQKFPHYFDSMTCSLIQAGEKTGTLDHMLERIANYQEHLMQLKKKIQQALFYPALVLLVAFIITLTLLIFVVPRFADLFQSAHSSLPAFTVAIISLANFVRHYGGWLGLTLVGGLSLLYYFRYIPQIRLIVDRLLLHLPGYGIAHQKFILSRFANNLAIFFAAGAPITEALKTLIHTTGNSCYANSIQKLYLDISAGKQLHFAMQTCKLFPTMMLQMVQVGEESGTLEKMLLKIAELYESDIQHLTANLSRLLEPLIMLILGVLIGGLIIAMYLPIFKLGAII